MRLPVSTAAHARLDSLREAETAAASSLDIARSQAANGLVPYLNVVYAEATLLDVQNQVAERRLALAQSTVSLFKALGGGWAKNRNAQRRTYARPRVRPAE